MAYILEMESCLRRTKDEASVHSASKEAGGSGSETRVNNCQLAWSDIPDPLVYT